MNTTVILIIIFLLFLLWLIVLSVLQSSPQSNNQEFKFESPAKIENPKNNYRYLIILTTTINTHSNISYLRQKYRDERTEIYRDSINNWNKFRNKNFEVVVVENSGCEMGLPDGMRLYSLDTSSLKTASKGQHELKSVRYVLDNIDLSQYDYVVKITGRYFVPELELELRKHQDFEVICQANPKRCEIIGCRVDLIDKVFEYPSSRDHVEDEYYERMKVFKRLFLPRMLIKPVRNGGYNELITAL